MNNSLNFEKMKDMFSAILTIKVANLVEFDELSIDDVRNLDDKFRKHLDSINQTIDLLEAARDNSDDLAMQAALLLLRTHSMSFAGFFDRIAKDIGNILNKSQWEEIPENYKIPEHYNFDY